MKSLSLTRLNGVITSVNQICLLSLVKGPCYNFSEFKTYWIIEQHFLNSEYKLFSIYNLKRFKMLKRYQKADHLNSFLETHQNFQLIMRLKNESELKNLGWNSEKRQAKFCFNLKSHI